MCKKVPARTASRPGETSRRPGETSRRPGKTSRRPGGSPVTAAMSAPPRRGDTRFARMTGAYWRDWYYGDGRATRNARGLPGGTQTTPDGLAAVFRATQVSPLRPLAITSCGFIRPPENPAPFRRLTARLHTLLRQDRRHSGKRGRKSCGFSPDYLSFALSLPSDLMGGTAVAPYS